MRGEASDRRIHRPRCRGLAPIRVAFLSVWVGVLCPTRMGTTQIPEQPCFYLTRLARENLTQQQRL